VGIGGIGGSLIRLGVFGGEKKKIWKILGCFGMFDGGFNGGLTDWGTVFHAGRDYL